MFLFFLPLNWEAIVWLLSLAIWPEGDFKRPVKNRMPNSLFMIYKTLKLVIWRHQKQMFYNGNFQPVNFYLYASLLTKRNILVLYSKKCIRYLYHMAQIPVSLFYQEWAMDPKAKHCDFDRHWINYLLVEVWLTPLEIKHWFK